MVGAVRERAGAKPQAAHHGHMSKTDRISIAIPDCNDIAIPDKVVIFGVFWGRITTKIKTTIKSKGIPLSSGGLEPLQNPLRSATRAATNGRVSRWKQTQLRAARSSSSKSKLLNLVKPLSNVTSRKPAQVAKAAKYASVQRLGEMRPKSQNRPNPLSKPAGSTSDCFGHHKLKTIGELYPCLQQSTINFETRGTLKIHFPLGPGYLLSLQLDAG